LVKRVSNEHTDSCGFVARCRWRGVEGVLPELILRRIPGTGYAPADFLPPGVVRTRGDRPVSRLFGGLPMTRFLSGGGVLLWWAVGLAGCNTMHGNMNNQTGMRLFQSGNYTAARSEFQRAVADEPWNADYLHNLATAQKRQGETAAAEATYRRALAANQAHQPSYHGLAKLLREEGRPAEARELLTGWAGSQPYSAEPFIELGWLEREEGNLTGAERNLRQALQLRPNDHVAAAQLGDLYQETDQTRLAQAMYRRSLYTRFYQPDVQERLAQLQAGEAQRRAEQPLARVNGPVWGAMGPEVPAYAVSATPYPRSGPLGALAGPAGEVLPGQPLGGFGPQPLPAGVALGGDPAHAEETAFEPPLVAPR